MSHTTAIAKRLGLAALLAGVIFFGVNPRGHRPQPGPSPAAATAPPETLARASEAPPTTSASRPPVPEALPVPPSTLRAPDLSSLPGAIARVEETRDSSDRLETPEELQHYKDDRRRFLAVQIAASRRDELPLPHDEAALAEMILRGELVELAPLTPAYLLYEIGTSVNIDPRTHYDAEANKEVPLLGSREEYEREAARLALEGGGRGRAASKAREQWELLVRNYEDPALREQLFGEHAAVKRLAADFGGVAYALDDPQQRASFVARLLSFVRPAARDVLLKLARGYQERFGRPLPVASLVRTARYQRRLARVNSNASTVEAAPHLSGEAFDISYKWMASDEQNFLMQQVAELESQGRVEALRERNNSLHVYVFAGGRRPPDALVAEHLDDVGDPPRVRKAPSRSRRAPARGGVRANRRY